MRKIRQKSAKFKGQNPFNAGLVAVVLLSNVLTTTVKANVVGSDMQNFNPSPDGLDFVTVQSSQTLEPAFVNFGLFINYAANTLPYFEDDKFQSRTEVNDTLWGLDLNMAVGVFKDFELGVSLPQVIKQTVNYEGVNGQFSDTGNTETRVMAKYRLWNNNETGVAAIASANINRVENNPYVGRGGQPTFNIEFAADHRIDKIILGANIGYRHRTSGEKLNPTDPIEPMKSQYIGSAAVSYYFEEIKSKLIFEIFGSRPVADEQNYASRLGSSAEVLLGLKYDVDTHLATHVGGASEAIHGQSSPDWRAYAGVNYTTGPIWGVTSRVTEPAPQPVVENVPAQPVEVFVIHDVLFEFNSDHLVLPRTKKMLEKISQRLKAESGFSKLEIVGHTDSIGGDAFNLKLSLRRANSIKKWLIKKHGVDAAKVVTDGKGKSEPIADNGNYQGRQKNRRVEFRIYR